MLPPRISRTHALRLGPRLGHQATVMRAASKTTAALGGKPGKPGRKPDDKEGPSFGKQVAGSDNAPGQMMHDISKGRFEYIGDFMASLNRGPVKLDYGKEAKPLTEKEKEMDELNERNLKMIQRSLLLGSALAAGGCYIGWVLTKWYYGVGNMGEFGEVMKTKMPKVSSNMEDSMIGRRMKDASEHSKEAVAENPELTDWRRSLRNKFNSPEGAQLARQNSIMMRERREQEKIERRSKAEMEEHKNALFLAQQQLAAQQAELRQEIAAVTAMAEAEESEAAESGLRVEAAADPSASEAAAVEPATAAEAPVRRLQRATSQVFVDLEKGGTAALSSSVDLVRSVSKTAETSVKRMVRRASTILPGEQVAVVSPSPEPEPAVAEEPKRS